MYIRWNVSSLLTEALDLQLTMPEITSGTTKEYEPPLTANKGTGVETSPDAGDRLSVSPGRSRLMHRYTPTGAALGLSGE